MEAPSAPGFTSETLRCFAVTVPNFSDMGALFTTCQFAWNAIGNSPKSLIIPRLEKKQKLSSEQLRKNREDLTALLGIPVTVPEMLQKYCPAVTDLELDGIVHSEEELFALLFPQPEQQRALPAPSGSALPPPPAKSLNTRLVRLSLKGCDFLTDAGLNKIFSRCPKLKKLDLSGCKKLTENAFSEETLPSLEELILQDCSSLSHQVAETIGVCCSDLRVLDLSNCSWVEDETVLTLVYCCPRLRSLKLDSCDITDGALVLFKTQERTLFHLSLAKCLRITNNGLEWLAPACKKLVALDLTGCSKITTDGLKLLIPEKSPLISLTLSGCSEIKEGGLCAILLRCRELTRLNLSGCKNVGDALLKILSNCRDLVHLDVSHCPLISTDGVESVAKLPKLKSLSLAYCNLSGEALLPLTRCPLDALNISGCRRATEDQLISLFQGGSRLWEEVTVEGVQGSLVYLYQIKHFLKVLKCNSCPAFTDEVLGSLVANCTALRSLEIRNCKGVTEKGIQSLSEKQQKLEIVKTEDTAPPSGCELM